MKNVFSFFSLFFLLPFFSFAQGPVDTTFNPNDYGFGRGDGAASGQIDLILKLPDGKYLIAGEFRSYNGRLQNRIARLDSFGKLDTTFLSGIGFDSSVRDAALQPDGKIVLVGQFSSYNGQTAKMAVRLNPDGTLDPTFSSGNGPNGTYSSLGPRINEVEIDSQGRILVGGVFKFFNTTGRRNLARLLPNGNVDLTFDIQALGPPNEFIDGLAIASGDNVLLSGNIYTIRTGNNGTPLTRKYFTKILANGNPDFSFNTGGTGVDELVEFVAVQPDQKIIIGGKFISYNGDTIERVARINADGTRDTTFQHPSWPAPEDYTVDYVLPIQAGASGYLVSGDFKSAFSDTNYKYVMRLNSTGGLVSTFNAGTGPNNGVDCVAEGPFGRFVITGSFTEFDRFGRNRIALLDSIGLSGINLVQTSGANKEVYEVVVQPDQKILIAGAFQQYNTKDLNRYGRLLPDGQLDSTFMSGYGANQTVRAIALTPDSKIILAGDFTRVRDTSRVRIARLLPNGLLDPTFLPGVGANSTIYCVAVQSDGKVIVGGSFTSVGGVVRKRLARFLTDGSLDAGFSPDTNGLNGTVYSLALAPDGKIYAGGEFTEAFGQVRNRVARLLADGTLDPSFDPGPGFDAAVHKILLNGSSTFYAGGAFSTYQNTYRAGLARIRSNGQLDSIFKPDSILGTVFSIQTYGFSNDVLASGAFSSISLDKATRKIRNALVRMKTNGATVGSYETGSGTKDGIFSLAIGPDKNVLAGGNFTSFDSVGRNRIMRLRGFETNDTFQISVSGAPTYCPNTTVRLAVDSLESAEYQWFFNGVKVDSATKSFIHARVSGSYSVRVQSNQLTSVSDTVYLGFHPVVPVNLVLGFGQLSVSGPFSQIKWFRDSVQIPQVDTNSITPTLPGIYQVQVLDTFGCPGFSNEVLVTSWMKNRGEKPLVGTPNPTSSSWNISGLANSEQIRYKILNLAGKTIVSGEQLVVDQTIRIDAVSLPPGLYMIELSDHNTGVPKGRLRLLKK